MRNADILVRWIFYLILLAILWRMQEVMVLDTSDHAMTAGIHQEWQDWRTYMYTAVPFVKIAGENAKEEVDNLRDERKKHGKPNIHPH